MNKIFNLLQIATCLNAAAVISTLDFSDYSLEQLTVRIESGNSQWQSAALRALPAVWSKQRRAENNAENNTRKDLPQEPVPAIIKRIIALTEIPDEGSLDDRLLAMQSCRVLPFAPPNLISPLVIRTHLKSLIKKTGDPLRKATCALALRDAFWLEGLPLDEEGVSIFTELLKIGKTDGQQPLLAAQEILLNGLFYMKNDITPLKEAIAVQASGPDERLNSIAKSLLKRDTSTKLTPEARSSSILIR